MYKETSDEILNRMLSKVPNDLNKNEGTFIFDSLSPIAEEIAQFKIQLNEALKRVFAKTAYKNNYSKDLENRVDETGINRKKGTKSFGSAIFEGEDGIKILKGTLVQTKNLLQYETIEERTIIEGMAKVPIEASDVGCIYNINSDTEIELPMQIVGVTSVTLGSTLTGGTNIEDNENLYSRYSNKVRKPTTSGNDNHYKQWAMEVSGVGNAKVDSLWNGPGTVKITIVDSNKHSANENLIKKVFDHIEENRPIGATVTVSSAKEKTIDVSVKVVLASGFNIGQVQQEFSKLLDKYLKDIAFKLTYVSIAKIGNILLNTPGVLDYTDLKLNNSVANIGLTDEEIPVVGTVELGV